MSSPRSIAQLCAALVALLSGLARAQPPPGYYDSAEGLTGDALQQALYAIIHTHTVHTYAQLWSDFQQTDPRQDNATKVWDIYSDEPGGTPPYVYTFVSDQCGTYDSEGDCYNREHSIPQSWFAGAFPMYTDLHHIYPVDGWVNNKRGELPYGDVGSADWTGQNGTRVGSSITPGYSGTVCEPIDAFKGDLARTYFYMATCYMPSISTWTSDVFSGNGLSPWAEAMFVAWSDQDPVSQKEVDRNNAVYALQGNRNPFIDRPEWVHSIWGPTAGVPALYQAPVQLWESDGVLHVRTEQAPLPAEILSLDGRSVATVLITGGSARLPELPAGIYLARTVVGTIRFVR